MKEIQNLLNQVSIITKKNAEFLDATGGRFNMFRMLGVDHYENMHSAILAELLNPKGSHGLKSEFLKIFVGRLVNKETISGFHCENASVRTEAGTDDGRIDIFVEDDQRHAIIIENKIYAADQWGQLKRYNTFALKKYGAGNYQILYLTLDGKEASENSKQDVKYVRISYSSDIIAWLEECVNLSARFPLVRETINQYINHLKLLTNQDMDTKNNQEIVELLSAPENLDAAFKISNCLPMVKNQIVNNIFLPQLTQICEELELTNISEVYDRVNTSYSGFKIKNPRWNYFKIGAEFESRGLRNLIIGFNHIDGKKRNDKTFNELKKLMEQKNSDWVWNVFPIYGNWENDAMKAILKGDMQKLFRNELERLLKLTKDFEM